MTSPAAAGEKKVASSFKREAQLDESIGGGGEEVFEDEEEEFGFGDLAI